MAGTSPGDPPYPIEGTLPAYMATRRNDGILRVLLLRAKVVRESNENDVSQTPNSQISQQVEQDRLPSNPFLIARSIEAVIGYENRSLVTATKEARGTRYVLRTQSPQVYKALLEMSHLLDEDKTPVEVVDHPRYNFTKGIVYDVDTIKVPDQDLLNELKNQGVTAVRRITKTENKVVKNTPLIILTFRGTIRPDHIFFGFIRINVRTYYDNVQICRNCAAYGHSPKNCTSETVCLTCSQSHQTLENQPCPNPPYCCHCEGGHSPVSKVCPVFRKEEAVIRLKTDRGISFIEARKEIEESSKAPSYASKVQGRLNDSSDKDREIKILRDELEKIREQMKDYVALKSELEALKQNINLSAPSTIYQNKTSEPKETHQTNTSNDKTQQLEKTHISRKDSGPKQSKTNNQPKPQRISKSYSLNSINRIATRSMSRKRNLDISPTSTDSDLKRFSTCPEPSQEVIISTDDTEMLSSDHE
ncbi:uncharacterized protein LOC129738082 [Uranotaenia lowii]|uniref:uncharacterized protein LOC129738082 n=1 Tax=Uranotaenia lowii TaxID=190385 RepID=UPI002479CE89|nr:uncharacterized protein LOC129738082 [Uranotaenia lowii]